MKALALLREGLQAGALMLPVLLFMVDGSACGASRLVRAPRASFAYYARYDKTCVELSQRGSAHQHGSRPRPIGRLFSAVIILDVALS